MKTMVAPTSSATLLIVRTTSVVTEATELILSDTSKSTLDTSFGGLRDVSMVTH